MQDNLVGVWKLRSFVMENVDTKERSEPFGPEPRGTLVLHANGRMVALLTARRTADATEADAAAPLKLLAYAGRYRLEPPDRLVTSVDVAWIEDWIGTEQTRTYRLEGDRLDLFTPTGRMPQPGGGEVTVSGVLSWTREAAMAIEATR
jgi:hypothetical protein